MMSLKKDIKKDFFKDDTLKGEKKPILYKNGKFYIPTDKGYIIKKRIDN